MKKIGITGGIGSGKSTVSEYLMKHGYDVIDCDKIAKEIVEPEFGLLKKLELLLGSEILKPDGTLDRGKTAEIVFADDEKRRILDELMHTAIRSVIERRFEKAYSNPVFVDAALLFETGFSDEMDEVWIITADKEVRMHRVIKRDNTDGEKVIARMNVQMEDEEKTKMADVVIDNSGDKEELFEKIEELLKVYV